MLNWGKQSKYFKAQTQGQVASGSLKAVHHNSKPPQGSATFYNNNLFTQPQRGD